MILSSAGISITLESADQNCCDTFEEFGLQCGTHCGVECSVVVPPGKPYHIICHTHEDIDFLSLEVIIDGLSAGMFSYSCGEPWIISHAETGTPFYFPVDRGSGRIEVVVLEVLLATSSSIGEDVISYLDPDPTELARCAFNYEATAPSSSKCLAQYVRVFETEPQEDSGERFDHLGQIGSETESCTDLSALSASFASFQLYAEESDVGLGVPVSMYEPLETASMMEWRMGS